MSVEARNECFIIANKRNLLTFSVEHRLLDFFVQIHIHIFLSSSPSGLEHIFGGKGYLR